MFPIILILSSLIVACGLTERAGRFFRKAKVDCFQRSTGCEIRHHRHNAAEALGEEFSFNGTAKLPFRRILPVTRNWSQYGEVGEILAANVTLSRLPGEKNGSNRGIAEEIQSSSEFLI